MQFKISVIIPAYNAESTITRAIHSVLSQTYPAYEIIVINDGSNDSTEEAVAPFCNNVKYFALGHHFGTSTARNTGIQKASGNWIAFLDSDDEWLPEKLEYQVRLIKNNPSIKWCIGNYKLKTLTHEEIKIKKKPPGYICENKKGDNGLEGFIIRNYFEAAQKGYCDAHTNLILIQKGVLEETGLFDATLYRSQDVDLWWRIALRFPKVGYIHKPLALWKRCGGDDALMMKRVEAKKGHYLRKVYDKNLKEVLQLSARGQIDDPVVNYFINFASHNLFKSILMMIFLGHKDMARKTLFQFEEIFSTVSKFFIKIVLAVPLMHYIIRSSYYASQKLGLASKTDTYWDYLRFMRKNKL
jgi:glycosyltransferase involved in cell wall biosynthesis